MRMGVCVYVVVWVVGGCGRLLGVWLILDKWVDCKDPSRRRKDPCQRENLARPGKDPMVCEVWVWKEGSWFGVSAAAWE